MATTTTNFGWDIPQSTDLVKDGATAIAALGQDIDTSMAELKGGTTGQILSKSSNTDMDFTWTTPNPGDITGVTAGTGITGGGTSGDVTVSFDVANYGGGQYAAGKNKIINGDFGIWQRGTSFSAQGYLADRFRTQFNGSGATRTMSQQTFTAGTAPVAGYESQYFFRYDQSVAGTGGTYNTFEQYIEDVRTFANQTATFSFWAKAASSVTITATLSQNFGSGGSTTVDLTAQNVALTTSWQRFTLTFSVPSISGKTIGSGSALRAVLLLPLNSTFTIDIWGVQLEAGSTATPFQTATGTKQGELAACQRYYWRDSSTSLFAAYGYGNATSTTAGRSYFKNPVPMRIIPTSVDYANLTLSDGVASFGFTSLTIDTAVSGLNVSCVNTGGHSGLTQYRSYFMSANNSSSAYIGFNAEL